jgi:hypothetical protein
MNIFKLMPFDWYYMNDLDCVRFQIMRYETNARWHATWTFIEA